MFLTVGMKLKGLKLPGQNYKLKLQSRYVLELLSESDCEFFKSIDEFGLPL